MNQRLGEEKYQAVKEMEELISEMKLMDQPKTKLTHRPGKKDFIIKNFQKSHFEKLKQ